jgi:hypothetical protein
MPEFAGCSWFRTQIPIEIPMPTPTSKILRARARALALAPGSESGHHCQQRVAPAEGCVLPDSTGRGAGNHAGPDARGQGDNEDTRSRSTRHGGGTLFLTGQEQP